MKSSDASGLPTHTTNKPAALSWQLLRLLLRDRALQYRMAYMRRTGHFVSTAQFDRVQRFCFFIAPARSGHSIVARLLSAHPDVLISDELHALHHLNEGCSADLVYTLIREQDARLALRRRSKSGYDYSVPGTAQGRGRKKHPLVIGDAKGGGSVRLLFSNPELIERVRAEVGGPLRVFVRVRHPFDIIGSMMRRRGRSLKGREMRNLAHRLETVAGLFREDETLFQTHEELIADPKGQLERLFRFLDVEPIPAIVEACAAKIWEAPHRTRSAIQWEGDEQERLIEDMKTTRFFARYFTAEDGPEDPLVDRSPPAGTGSVEAEA